MDAHESGQGIVTYISLIVRRSGQTKISNLRESACAGEILREKSQHLSSTVLFADFFQISRVAHETDGTSKPLILLDSQDWPPLRSPCKISISHEIRCQARVFRLFPGQLAKSASKREILRLVFSDCAKAGAGISDREVAQTRATTTALPA